MLWIRCVKREACDGGDQPARASCAMNPAIGYAALAIMAGLLIPVMARLNGTLSTSVGNVGWPALIVTGGAFVGALLFVASQRSGPPAALADQPVHYWFAGLIMAFYVISITWLVPRFGTGPAIMCVVVAQLFAAAAIDQYGLFGAPTRPMTGSRAAGLALLVVGVLLAARPPKT